MPLATFIDPSPPVKNQISCENINSDYDLIKFSPYKVLIQAKLKLHFCDYLRIKGLTRLSIPRQRN